MSDGVIDSCCLINLCAVGQLGDVLPPLGLAWHIPPPVEAETLFLRTREADGSSGREAVDLQPSIDAGVLQICVAQPGDEIDLYVELAGVLDDAEAMTLAIAKCRKWVLATDDRLAIRYATDLDVTLITTPELMKKWAEATGATPERLSLALERIHSRARFTPSPKFPEYEWWVRSAARGTQ